MSNSTKQAIPPSENITLIPATPIPTGSKPWGVAVDEENFTAYIADSGNTTITTIDTRSHNPGNPVNLQHSPDHIILNKRKHVLYALSFEGYVTPVDTKTNKPGVPLDLGGGFARVTTDSITLDEKNDILYVGDYYGQAIYCIDLKTGKPTPYSPIQLSDQVQDIEFEESNNTLYALFGAEEDQGYVIPINADNQSQGTEVEVGYGPWTMVLDRTNHYLYISNADGTITILNTISNAAHIHAINVKLHDISSLAVDEELQILYVVDRGDVDSDGTVLAIKVNVQEPKVDSSLQVGFLADGIAVDQRTHTVWVTNMDSNTATPIQPKFSDVRIVHPNANGVVSAGSVRFSGVGEPDSAVRVTVTTANKAHKLILPLCFVNEKNDEWEVNGTIKAPGKYIATARQFVGKIEMSRYIVRFTVSTDVGA